MKTLKLRIKDKHCKVLDQLASEVNLAMICVSNTYSANNNSFQHTILLNTRKAHQRNVIFIAKPFRL